jgi:predicted  nucleic acid-binding Zn-ribbon protein
MEDTTILDAPANVDAEYEAAIDRNLHEMERLRDDMEARQQRIEQMQAETQALLAQLEQLRAA